MSEQTKIEWCDSTFNPWVGCTRISPACDHCYAAVSTPARTLGVEWGPHAERRRTSAANWKQPLRWEREHEAFHAQHGRRRRVFCASLADVFDNAVPQSWRSDLFDLIDATPYLDWLLLTKRVGNVSEMLHEIGPRTIQHGAAFEVRTGLPPNVWLGATIANQEEADRDIPKLLAVPARVRFLSVEPMLGPISLRWLPAWPDNAPTTAQSPTGRTNHLDGLRRLDWIICGGESGPHARPMHPDWPRSLRDQCAAAGVPFLFKQWGEWMQVAESAVHPEATRIPGNLCRVQSISAPDRYVAISTNGGRRRYEIERVGKRAAGRMLDGVVHDAWPDAAWEG